MQPQDSGKDNSDPDKMFENLTGERQKQALSTMDRRAAYQKRRTSGKQVGVVSTDKIVNKTQGQGFRTGAGTVVQKPGQSLNASRSSHDLGARPSFGLGGVLNFMDKPQKSLLFESLQDDAGLPDEFDVDKVEKAEKNFCQLCFIDGLGTLMNWSHHCRRCGKTVCGKCGTNKRHLSKKDKKNLYRICDQCDTILSNLKLKQNQDFVIQAQKDQIEIIEYTISTTDEELIRLKEINGSLSSKQEHKIRKKWDKRAKLDEEMIQLAREIESLKNTKNNLANSINNDERLLQELLDEKKKLNVKKQQMQEEIHKQEKLIAEKEAQNQKLREQLEQLKQRQENRNMSPKAEQMQQQQSKINESEQQRLEKLRNQKMKAYLDSVSQHKIEETPSEQNTSFISVRKDSSFGGLQQHKKSNNGLEGVDEVDDDYSKASSSKDAGLQSLYKK